MARGASSSPERTLTCFAIAGLVVVDLNDPLKPSVAAEIGAPDLQDPRGIAIQFRYAFVVDREGLKVLDVSDLGHPRVVPNAAVPLEDARNIYVARTYAYVAAGKQGIAIVDVEKPEQPRLDQVFTRRWQAQRRPGRQNRNGRCQRIRVRRRRKKWSSRTANPLARGFAQFLRLQSASHSQADRFIPHGRTRTGNLEGNRSRSRRGRKRQPDRGLRPSRRSSFQSRRSLAPVHARWQTLHGLRRSAHAGVWPRWQRESAS